MLLVNEQMLDPSEARKLLLLATRIDLINPGDWATTWCRSARSPPGVGVVLPQLLEVGLSARLRLVT